LTLEQSEIPLSLPDVEVDGVWSGMRQHRALLLGRLRLRRNGRTSCSCWAATALPEMRARILRSASMSCAEAPRPSRLTLNTPEAVCSTSGILAPALDPAEGWTTEAEGLAGSGASGGVDAWAVVASPPADRVLAMRSWILPRGGRQTVGGIRARRWTPTQQPPESSTLLRRGYGRRPPRRWEESSITPATFAKQATTTF
jgi:hypothetical protein